MIGKKDRVRNKNVFNCDFDMEQLKKCIKRPNKKILTKLKNMNDYRTKNE